jgi:hypothetical protein
VSVGLHLRRIKCDGGNTLLGGGQILFVITGTLHWLVLFFPLWFVVKSEHSFVFTVRRAC